MFCHETNNFHGSFVKMPATKVTTMGQATLNNIKKAREEYRKEETETYRQMIMKGFWHRFFKKPVPTDEEVKAWREENVVWDLDWASIRYDEQERTAKRLLQACSQVEEIYISTEDLQKIS